MSNFITWLSSLINGIESEKEMIIRLVAAAAVFVLLLVFRNKIAKGVSVLFCRIFLRKSENAARVLKSSVYKPLAYFIAVLGAYAAAEILFPAGDIHNYAAVILKLAFIGLAAWFGVNFINADYSLIVSSDTSGSKKTAVKFINNLLKVLIVTVALLLVLEQFGISASKLFAALGIGGVAVAFACKDMVENMLSGFIIIFDKPFEVGDYIELDGDGGTVCDIKIRTTRLIGADGCQKVYPNTTMANTAITNWTKMKKRAVNETIGVNYSASGDDMRKICAEIKDVIRSCDSVIGDDIRVNFTEFGSHALEIQLFFYVDKIALPEYLSVKSNINSALKNYFDRAGIALAFESKTLYFGDELKIKSDGSKK